MRPTRTYVIILSKVIRLEKGFYYIVVTVGSNHCFVNGDMDLSDRFEEVKRFDTREDAEEFIQKHLHGKRTKILPFDVA